MKSKLFAMYLPQYHEIEENNLFWGKGFTDWVSVKNGTPIYKDHIQPRKPLDDYYYDLSKPEDVKWQCELAKKYGIDGFGIYHYWFNDEKNLLTKPAENILADKSIDISYFFAWDNISWKRTWSKVAGNDWAPIKDQNQQKTDKPILIEYKLGEEKEWENHFNWLLPFFKDDRYEKKAGKPIFMIYNFDLKIIEMGKYWDKLAKDNGLAGIEIIYRYDKKLNIPENEISFRYEPIYSGWCGFNQKLKNKIYTTLKINKLKSFNYDKVWKKIIKNSKNNPSNMYLSGFVNYDDTPRRGIKGRVIKGGSPEKFEKYLGELYNIACDKNIDYVFLTAWNEWGEGAYLEPDSDTKYMYLEAVKNIKETK